MHLKKLRGQISAGGYSTTRVQVARIGDADMRAVRGELKPRLDRGERQGLVAQST